MRVHRALDVHDVVVGEAAHDLRDGVGLADVREELVAEPLALARAAHDAGDVDERHRRGQDALGVEDLGELRQPRIGQAHDADVRLDRRERIVRREHVVLGQRVEEGGLADVGQTDDADSESHGHPVYGGRMPLPVVTGRRVGGSGRAVTYGSSSSSRDDDSAPGARARSHARR